MQVIEILIMIGFAGLIAAFAGIVFPSKDASPALTPALLARGDKYPATVELDSLIRVPALEGLSGALNESSTNHTQLINTPFKSKLSNPIHLVCATPSQVKELVGNISKESAKEGGSALSVLWSDKGVWSSTFNFKPDSRYNLYKPFDYNESTSYFWGVSGDTGRNSVLMAGTTLECKMPATSKSDLENGTPLEKENSDILPVAQVSSQLKAIRVGYVSDDGWVRVSKNVESEYNEEVMYRVGTYVVSQISSFKQYKVQPETLHFKNMIDVSIKGAAFLDFKDQDAIIGSVAQHDQVYMPIITRTSKMMAMPENEAYTDFKVLNIKVAPVKEKSISSDTVPEQVVRMNTAMAEKIKQLEENIKRLEQEKNSEPKSPIATSIKVPVVAPPVAAPKVEVDDRILAKNISGN